MIHTHLNFHTCSSPTRLKAAAKQVEIAHMCMGVVYSGDMCTQDDCVIIIFRSPFLNNKGSIADDRYFPVHTEDTLEHSKPALDGWEGSGCWLDCVERLCKVALQLDVW